MARGVVDANNIQSGLLGGCAGVRGTFDIHSVFQHSLGSTGFEQFLQSCFAPS